MAQTANGPTFVVIDVFGSQGYIDIYNVDNDQWSTSSNVSER